VGFGNGRKGEGGESGEGEECLKCFVGGWLGWSWQACIGEIDGDTLYEEQICMLHRLRFLC